MMRLTLLVAALSAPGAVALKTDEMAGLENVIEMLKKVRKDSVATREKMARAYDKVAGECKWNQESTESAMQDEIAKINAASAAYDQAVAEAAQAAQDRKDAVANGLQARKELDAMVAAEKADQKKLHATLTDAQAGMNAAYAALLTIHQWQPDAASLTWPEDTQVSAKLASMNDCTELNAECKNKIAHGSGPAATFLQTFDSIYPSAQLVGGTIKEILLQDGVSHGKLTAPHVGDLRGRDYGPLLAEIEKVADQMANSWKDAENAYQVSKTTTGTNCDVDTRTSIYGLGTVFVNSESEFDETKGFCAGTLGITQLDEAITQSKSDNQRQTTNAGARKAELVQLQASLADNRDAYKKTTAACENEAKMYTRNSKLATEEFEALKMVMDIIEQGMSDVNAVTSPTTPATFIQESIEDFPMNLLQLSMHKSHMIAKPENPHKAKFQAAIAYLQEKSKSNHNPALTMVMMELSAPYGAARDPFHHVVEMINRLIATLEQEATDDASNHGFCKSQMAAANSQRKNAQASIKSLMVDMKKAGADMDAWMADHSNAMHELYRDTTSLKNMQKNREETSAENKDAMKQAKIAYQTMKHAMSQLHKMATETASRAHIDESKFLLIQKPTEYSGQQGGFKNVMDMLQVLHDRFESNYAALQDQEHDQAMDFAEMKTELSARMAASTARATSQSQAIVARMNEFMGWKSDLADQNGILKAAFDKLEALRPTCVETHSAKIQKLQSTISSLESTLDILKNHAGR